jgi:hypothetical protein
MHRAPAAAGKNTKNAAEKTCKKRKHRATSRHPMFSGGEKKSFFNLFLLSAAAQSHFNRK